jgi:hypothetical protein
LGGRYRGIISAALAINHTTEETLVKVQVGCFHGNLLKENLPTFFKEKKNGKNMHNCNNSRITKYAKEIVYVFKYASVCVYECKKKCRD